MFDAFVIVIVGKSKSSIMIDLGICILIFIEEVASVIPLIENVDVTLDICRGGSSSAAARRSSDN